MAEEGTRERDAAPDRRTWRLVALGVLLSGIAAAAALWLLRPQQEGEEPPERAPLVAVKRIEARSDPIRVTGQGTVRPANEVALSPQVGGRVTWVNPDLRAGERVRRGEILVRIESDDYAARAEEARAEVERARLDLARAEETQATREEEFERLRGRLEQDGDARSPDAIEGDFVRPGEADGRSTATLAEDPSPLALGEREADAAKAALAGARARLESARRDVARTRLTAPFSGIVRSKSVERGQFVRPGEQLAELYDAGVLEIAVPLTQQKAALIPRVFAPVTSGREAGVPATVRIDFGGARWAWDAIVEGAQGDIDAQTRTLGVVVRVARPIGGGRAAGGAEAAGEAPPLLPGFFADVEFLAETPPAYFAIPRDALRGSDREGGRVWAVRDGAIVFVPVRVIARAGPRLFVTGEALADGERIVTGDLASVTEGMAVRTGEQRATPALDARESGGETPAIGDGA